MSVTEVNSNRIQHSFPPASSNFGWYALRTRSNCEKIAALFLQAKGYEHFLPTYLARRRKLERVVETVLPLFPGYLFCRFDASYRTPILSAVGVVSIVNFCGKFAQIDNAEIEAVRRVLGSGNTVEPYAYLREGQRIRIQRGAMQGLEGIIIKKRTWRIVISVNLLQRSVSVEIDPESVATVSA